MTLPEMKRCIVHLDLDYFFAQCEEVRDPQLKGKPLMVCVYSGRSEDSGVISTANYEARKFGVKSGIPIVIAKKYLIDIPESIFLPMNRDMYSDLSQKVMAIAREYGDPIEQTGLDECYIEITRRLDKDFEGSEDLADLLKEKIRKLVGLTSSIGIAPNKLVAKIASEFCKPDGLKLVRPEDVLDFLSPLSINQLPGIGKKMLVRMNDLGVSEIGDLRELKLEALMRECGKSQGLYFHDAAHGIDNLPVKERGEAEQIGRIVTLKEDSNDLNFIKGSLERISGDVYDRCQERGVAFRSLGVILITDEIKTYSRSRTFDSKSISRQKILELGCELTEIFLRENPAIKIRRIGLKLYGFEATDNQTSLSQFMN